MPSVTRSVRLDGDLHEELLKVAEAQDRSVNWIIGQAISAYCASATQTRIEEARRAPGESYAGSGGGSARFDKTGMPGARDVTPLPKGGKR